jgi:hypothetical protein
MVGKGRMIINIPLPGLPDTMTAFCFSVLNPAKGFVKTPVVMELSPPYNVMIV